MKDIFGLDGDTIRLIAEDGAPSGPREFMIWSPSHRDNDLPITEATRLMRFLMARGIRVILFCKVSDAFRRLALKLSFGSIAKCVN